MQNRKEEKPTSAVSRPTRWEKNLRQLSDNIITLNVNASLFGKYGKNGNPLGWTVGKIGYVAGASADGVGYLVNSCCRKK